VAAKVRTDEMVGEKAGLAVRRTGRGEDRPHDGGEVFG
jgi:hypothetical protein